MTRVVTCMITAIPILCIALFNMCAMVIYQHILKAIEPAVHHCRKNGWVLKIEFT